VTTVVQMLWGLETGGKEQVVTGLVQRLDPGLFRMPVWALCRRGPHYDRLREAGHPVRCFEKRAGFDPATVLTVRRALRNLRPDIVHAHEFTSAAAAALAIMPGAVPPLVMTLHGGFLDLPPGRRNLHRRLLARAAVVTAVSEHLCRVVHNDTLGDVHAHWIPPGIDLAAFDAAADAAPPLDRAELGVPEDGPLVICVMRLEAPKNPLLLVQAARRVCRDEPQCRFVIVGDGAERGAAEAMAAETGLAANVFFVGERGGIPRLLRAADVGVLASLREGLPLALLEYMAAGLPVVATNVGGVEEAVEDGAGGFLVAPYDDAALARRIVELLRHPAEAAEMGAAGRRAVEAQFNVDIMVRSYARLYRTLLS